MKTHAGVWLPDADDHLMSELDAGPRIAGHPTYQFDKFSRCLPYMKGADVACNVGAGVGLWCRSSSTVFNRVVSFEADADRHACHMRNCSTLKNVTSYNIKLGKYDEHDQRRLDGIRLFRGKSHLDFMRVSASDSHSVLTGAEATIRRHEPCILLGYEDTAVELLEDWGMQVQWHHSDSCLMVWRQKT